MKRIGCLALALAMMLCVCAFTSCNGDQPEQVTYGALSLEPIVMPFLVCWESSNRYTE